MGLMISRLEKRRELPGGVIQARCPACAEAGGDRTGNHLRIYRDGRFGCCVHPRDHAHRSRIFALAGDKTRRMFTVNICAPRPAAEPKSILGSLGSLNRENGTLGTGIFKSLAVAEKGTYLSNDN